VPLEKAPPRGGVFLSVRSNKLLLAALALKAQGKEPRIGPEKFPHVPYPQPMFVLPPWEGGDGGELKSADGTPARKARVAA